MNRSLFSQVVGVAILTGATITPVILVGLIVQGLQLAFASV